MKKIALALGVLFTSQLCIAQADSCMMATPASPPTNPFTNILCPSMGNYYPFNFNNNSPSKTIVPLNIIYMHPPSGVGKWDTVTSASSQKLVQILNRYMDSILPPHKPLPAPYTAPYYTEAKINFSYKQTYHITHSSYYNFNDTIGKMLMPDTNAINVFFADKPGNGVGYAFGIPSRGLFVKSGGDVMLENGSALNLLHELCHCMGLWHVNEYINANGQWAVATSNPNGTLLSQIIDDYWVEDPTQWYQFSNGTNNIMGYWWGNCRYISPKQLGYMHYMLLNHPMLKNIPTARVQGNSDCLVDHNNDITINSNITLSGSALYPPGDLIIQSGKHVTLNSCLVMRENAKIIVQPGAKLSILGGGVSTMESCPSHWWGIEVQSNQNAVQSLNSSNASLPGSGVGMLELDHATLSNARCAVYVSQDAGTYIGNNVPATGAGIVYSNNSQFINNQYGMYFDSYYTLGGVTNNLSYSRRDSFVVNSNFRTSVGNAIPINSIRIDKANGIEIIGDYFSDTHHMTSTAISVTDADVKIVDHCASSGCSGTRMRNRFYGFRSAVDVGNSFNIVPAVVDHVKIEQGGTHPDNTYGSIYMLNSLAPNVLNSDIETYFKSVGQPYTYGIYLDNCDAYAVENNNLSSMYAVRTIGAVINNSGPAGNSVYNNSFTGLYQGLWAQHQNYDPVTGAGLVMNCNDFLTGTNYNIGVQGYGVSTTGVAEVQGNATSLEQDYVRNKYTPSGGSCPNNSETKYYINSPNSFVITSHGSFLQAVYQPIPQTNNSCSNPSEVVNIVGINVTTSKATHCPVNYLPTYSKSDLQAKVSSVRETKRNLTLAYYQSLDGGDTQVLLDYIFTSPGVLTLSQLRDTLKSKDFLSDTVLKAYFLHPSAPETDFNEVFLLNYPLQPSVWSIVPSIGLSGGMYDDWETHQQYNQLSPREEVRSQLVKAHSDLAIYGNEKVRRFLTDSSGPKYDSLVAHYRLNESGMSQWNLARTYIAANRTTDATDLIDSLETADTSNTDVCRMLRYTLRLATDESYADTLRADSNIYAFLVDRATYSLKPVKEGYSRALLRSVYGEALTPERLHPEESEEGGRMAATPSSLNNILEEKDQVLIYPNPASQSLNVKVQKNKGPFVVKISNLEGKTMLTQTCAQDCEIQLQTLINGVYLLHLYKEDQLLKTKKVVVIK